MAEETFTPTSIDDLVNRSGRPRDEHGRFVAQPREDGGQPGAEEIALETRQPDPQEGEGGGEAQSATEGTQADGEAATDAGAAPAPTGDKTTTTPAKAAPQAPVAAITAERRKGQAANDELAQARARIAELEAQAKAPPATIATVQQPAQQPAQPRRETPAQRAARASVFDDENAFADGVLSEADQRAEAKIFGRHIAMSEMYLRREVPDFEDVMGTKTGADGEPEHTNFRAILTPELWAKFQASPDPARFAYETTKRHLETQRLADPKTREELIEAEVQKRLAAANGAKPAAAIPPAQAPQSPPPAKAQPKPAPAAPPASIATQQSSNLSRGAPQFQGPTTLEALINQVGKTHATTN